VPKNIPATTPKAWDEIRGSSAQVRRRREIDNLSLSRCFTGSIFVVELIYFVYHDRYMNTCIISL
jgi:hypothetical protein